MAESVDALVSNTSRFTPVPVRPRLWVQRERNESFSLFLYLTACIWICNEFFFIFIMATTHNRAVATYLLQYVFYNILGHPKKGGDKK